MEDNFGYLYILDFSCNRVCEIKLDEKDKESESEDILIKYGFKESACHFMFTEEKCELEIIKLD